VPSADTLNRIDRYIEELFAPNDAALEAALADSRAAGLPTINVSPNEGKLLHVLATLARPKRILELGTLGGYSTIWLARALQPGGRMISLEYSEKHAQVARANIARAGLAEQVEVRVGPALESLQRLADERAEPFDVLFIDADKRPYPEYLEWALRLTHPGSLIMADNVVRQGRVLDPGADEDMQAIRRFNAALAANPGLAAIVLPLVREDVDGIAVAVVK
jgi:predicted O-methyltransferase YrrM